MERVTGIGGFFFRADDPDALARWYAEHLGVGFPPEAYEDDVWYQEAGPTVFAPFGPQHWESPQLGEHRWGVNFRLRGHRGRSRPRRAPQRSVRQPL